jgi:hypothetical protein
MQLNKKASKVSPSLSSMIDISVNIDEDLIDCVKGIESGAFLDRESLGNHYLSKMVGTKMQSINVIAKLGRRFE